MKSVTVRNMTIGVGMPKICLPIVARTAEEMLQQTQQCMIYHPDLIEIRIDYLKKIDQLEEIRSSLMRVRTVVGETPILFTFRTKQEGGEQLIDTKQYERLLLETARTGLVDLMDVELFFEGERLGALIEQLHESSVAVIVSNHDFEKTASSEELIKRIRDMQQAGADVAKIAMMPVLPADVLTLLSVTEQMNRELKIPLITMSMGKCGAVSRLCGELTGSAVTFASAGNTSAPGQMQIDDVRKILRLLSMRS